MADWGKPTNSSQYTDVLSNLKDRDEDAAKLFPDNPTNHIEGMIRIVRASDSNADAGSRIKFQERIGSAWVDRPIALDGGGTGKKTAAAVLSSLGLGTLASQNSNSVSITGGSIAAATITGKLNAGRIPSLAASIIGSGEFSSSRIPNLNANKITAGLLSIKRIPDFDASKISTGTINKARLPATASQVILIDGEFSLTALSKVTKNLTADITGFRFIVIIGGDNSSFGRGLGSTIVPRSVIPVGSGSVDEYLYGTGSNAAGDRKLFRINQSNGAIISEVSLNSSHSSIGEVGGTLYGTGSRGIFSINRITGANSYLGNEGKLTSSGTGSQGGLAGLGDVLYGLYGRAILGSVSGSGWRLFTVNRTTGSATTVRERFGNFWSNAFGGLNGVLYGVISSRLYSGLQPGGSITNIGALGVGISDLAGLGGRLYGIRRNSSDLSSLYSINISTGAATLLGTNSAEIRSLAGLDAGVGNAARINIIPSKRVDIWRPTNTNNRLGFYSNRPTTILKVIGIP